MPSLREYLKRRRGEIRAENERLAQQRGKLQNQLHSVLARLGELDREFAELDQAAKAVGLETDAPTALARQPAVESRSLPSTIKEAVLHVLADAPGGMTSQALLDELNERFFSGRIERTSFSPELSRLRGDHKVTRRGEIWTLTATGNLTPGFEGGDDVPPRAGRRRSSPSRGVPRRPWRRQSDRHQRSAAPAIGPPRTERTERTEPETDGGSPSTSIETLDPSGNSESSRE
jgi:hypothetical protein